MHPKDVNSNPTGERADNPQQQETPAATDQRKLNKPELQDAERAPAPSREHEAGQD